MYRLFLCCKCVFANQAISSLTASAKFLVLCNGNVTHQPHHVFHLSMLNEKAYYYQ